MKINVNNIIISIEKNQDKEIEKEISKRGIQRNNIEKVIWTKRSIDSRKKSDIKFVYNVEVILKNDVDISKLKNISIVKETKIIERKPINSGEEVLVVGTGPAGLFAALRLAEYGYKPIIIERGEAVDERDKTVDNFIKTGRNPYHPRPKSL